MPINNYSSKQWADIAEIKRTISALHAPSEVLELRAFFTGKVKAGYFDNHDALAKEAVKLSGYAEGVYMVLNPFDPALLSRAVNRVDSLKNTTQDKDILRRHYLPMDCDPVRPTGISSTNEEHETALLRAMDVRAYLGELGFSANSIIAADSSNGAHVLVRIDLANDDGSEALVKSCLEALAAKFNDHKVVIDTSVFNAARIWKLYGTMARKGDATLERPHRIARLLTVPTDVIPAPLEALRALASTAPKVEGRPLQRRYQGTGQPFDLETWLGRNRIEVTRIDPYEGGKRYILKVCPFNSEHTGTSVAVFQAADGTLGFKCQHNSCASKTWVDLRELKEPGYRDRRSGHQDTPLTLKVVEKAPPKIPTSSLTELLAHYQKHFYLRDTGHIEVVLGTIAANYGKGDPEWIQVIGTPGRGKTEPIISTRGLPHIYLTSSLTEAALLSGTASKEREKSAKGGLLREMGSFGILVVKDFSGMLALQKDTRAQILSALREVHDGEWTRRMGVDGGKTLHWEGKCGLIAASTPAIDSYYQVMAILGDRFVFYRMPDVEDDSKKDEEDDKLADKALDLAGNENQAREEIAAAVNGFFESVKISDAMPTYTPTERQKIKSLAIFAVRCRSAVDRDTYSSREIQLIPGTEAPPRVTKVLSLLFRGLLDIGCTRQRAWQLIEKVALDSMPLLRQTVLFRMLREPKSEWTAPKLGTELGYPTTTTRRTLEDLACYKIVARDKAGRDDVWTLTDWTVNTYQKATGKIPEIEANPNCVSEIPPSVCNTHKDSNYIYPYIPTGGNLGNITQDERTSVSPPCETIKDGQKVLDGAPPDSPAAAACEFIADKIKRWLQKLNQLLSNRPRIGKKCPMESCVRLGLNTVWTSRAVKTLHGSVQEWTCLITLLTHVTTVVAVITG